MALANQVVDFIDDTDKTLLKQIASKAPETVKTASVLSIEEREKLPAADFALILRTKEAQILKKYPITDAANTWLSAQYFAKTAEQLPYVAQKIAASNLRRAAAIFNVALPEMIEKLASREVEGNVYNEIMDKNKEKPMTKIAAAPQSDGSNHFYALGHNYAMPSPEYVKKAAVYFTEHVAEFQDAEDRYNFANNVIERAKELHVELECKEQLNKYAGAQYGDSVGTQLRMRQDLLQHKPEMSSALFKLAEHQTSTEPKTFAKALYLFDKKAGLSRYYGSGNIADAFQSTFGTFFKSAGYRWEDESSGLSIGDKELSKLASDKYDRIKSYFGTTLADSLKKHAAEIFDSLPKDAQITIVKIGKGEI